MIYDFKNKYVSKEEKTKRNLSSALEIFGGAICLTSLMSLMYVLLILFDTNRYLY